jgi:NAD(P)-dependent dehydrogenase (short-subunit alcohol dehydrogenase family)
MSRISGVPGRSTAGLRLSVHRKQSATCPGGGGTVIFTGATSAVRSLGGAIGFTAAKFAAHGMAMEIAQEFGPEGVHVAHVVIDGQIDALGVGERVSDRGDETSLDPDEMAGTH